MTPIPEDNSLKTVLQDNSGGLSSTRLSMLLWVVGVFVVWAAISVTNKALQDLPDSVLVLFGILITGKVTQRFGERPLEESQPVSLTPDRKPPSP